MRRLGAAALLLLASSCELSPRIYLTVRTESGSPVRQVRVQVFSPSASEAATDAGNTLHAIAPTSPFELRVLGRAGGERVRVTVDGLGDDATTSPIIRQEWIASMPSEGAGYLQVVLWNACQGVVCPPDSTCSSAGTCVRNTVTMVQTAGTDAGLGACPDASGGACQSVADASRVDATVDVTIDAPIDAGMVDVPTDRPPTDLGAPDVGNDLGGPVDVPPGDVVDASEAGRCPAWSPSVLTNWTSCAGGGSCPALCGSAPRTCVQVERIAPGRDHGCALRDDGQVSCWGARSDGRLGDGPNDGGVTSTPVIVRRATVFSPLAGVTALGAGYDGTCAVTGDGGLFCWGAISADPLNFDYNPGLWATPAERLFRADAGALNLFASVATHSSMTCALVRGGTVRCSTWVRFRPDGEDEIIERPSDYPVTDIAHVDGRPLTDVRAIGTGIFHACALRGDGTVWCWGSNRYGQLGAGLPVDDAGVGSSLTARQVPGLTGVTSLGVGDFFGCALVGGAVRCWGMASLGRAGGYRGAVECSSGNVCSPAPVAVEGLAALAEEAGSPVVQVVAGAEQGCARLDSGQVWCWGMNDVGQIGLPMTGAAAVDSRGALEGRAVFEGADDVVTGGGGGGGAQSWSCARRRADCTWWCWGRIPGEATPPADLGTPRPMRWGG